MSFKLILDTTVSFIALFGKYSVQTLTTDMSGICNWTHPCMFPRQFLKCFLGFMWSLINFNLLSTTIANKFKFYTHATLFIYVFSASQSCMILHNSSRLFPYSPPHRSNTVKEYEGLFTSGCCTG